MVKIVQKDAPDGKKVLRDVAKPVKKSEIGSDKLDKIISDMHTVLATQDDGVALAAPQIAVPLRMFVISPRVYEYMHIDFPDDSASTEKHFVFINPEITWMSKDKKTMDEGCLSVRPWYGKVKRATRARIKATDENGNEFEMEGSGLVAQIFQHETDHLEGVLFTDKAKHLKELPEIAFGSDEDVK